MYRPIKIILKDILNNEEIKRINMKSVNDVVVEKILTIMKEQKLTQYMLSQKSGVSFSTIKSIMQRKTNNITLKTLIMICDGLNISPSDFLNDDAFLAENLDI